MAFIWKMLKKHSKWGYRITLSHGHRLKNRSNWGYKSHSEWVLYGKSINNEPKQWLLYGKWSKSTQNEAIESLWGMATGLKTDQKSVKMSSSYKEPETCQKHIRAKISQNLNTKFLNKRLAKCTFFSMLLVKKARM